ncbi:hypothetical protein [Haloarcula regularis]|nr:hypothetical protein [Halomicroarcula sp. SYNS111]
MPPWNRDREHTADSETDEEDLPSFLNEADDELEVLTDGGDGEED